MPPAGREGVLSSFPKWVLAEGACDRAAQLTGIGAAASSMSDVLLTLQRAFRNNAQVSQPDLAKELVGYCSRFPFRGWQGSVRPIN